MEEKKIKSILGIKSLVFLKGPYITGLHLSFFAIYCQSNTSKQALKQFWTGTVLRYVFIFGFLVKLFIPLTVSLSTEEIRGMYAVTSQVSTLGDWLQ